VNEKANDWLAVKALFEACLDSAPAARARLLADAPSPELRDEVEGLLRTHEAADVLEQGAAAWAAPLFAADGLDEDAAGERIGPFRTVSVLGRGGMGVVWLAERDEPGVRQRVAIKRIRMGLDSAEVRVRFRRERGILARLAHDRIARLIDGGVDSEGHPWLALEYVEGQPITRWCDERRLPVRERARLFVDVLDGVGYAHRNLVVHRDLKPANVLVDANGGVKLLDFGIAKLLADDDVENTATGAQVLTPACAAPEQLRGDPVSTVTDVYALGVLLYELVCGVAPYRLETTSRQSLVRAVLDEAAERPTRALTRTGVDADAIAAARVTTVAGLRRELDRDLTQIIDIALAKAPEDRYASVDAFAADLLAWLSRRPLLSRPTPRLRRAAQFVRRHRVGVAAGALIAVTALAGIGATAWQTRIATRHAQTARAVRDFTTQLFAAADPEQARGREVPLREVLDEGARRAERGLRDEPEVRGALLSDLGAIYASIGDNTRAVALLEQARDALAAVSSAAPEERARVLLRLAEAQYGRGQLDAAAAYADSALALLDGAMATEPLRLAAELTRIRIDGDAGRFAAADTRLAAVLAALRADPDVSPDEMSEALDALGNLRRLQTRWEDALAAQREALDLARRSDPDAPVVATRLNSLAAVEQQIARPKEAVAHLREALALQRRVHGPRHPDTLLSEAELAHVLGGFNETTEAEALFRANIEMRRAVFGAHNSLTANPENNYGTMLYVLRRFAEAAPLFEDAWRIWRETLGEEHPSTRTALTNYAGALLETGEPARAEPLLRDAWAQAQRLDPPRAHRSARNTYAIALERLGRLEEAERLLHEGVAADHAAFNGDEAQLAITRTQLGRVLRKRGDLSGAREQLEAAFSGYDNDEFPDGPRSAACFYELALVRHLQHEASAAARPLLERALRAQQEKLGPDNAETKATAELLAKLTR